MAASDDNKLQKAPLGLLGALALKVAGRNPTRFGDELSPQIEVYDQYLANDLREVLQQGSIGIGARTLAISHTPPQGFAWRVLAISSNFTLNAADVAITATAITSFTSPNAGGVHVDPQGAMVVNGATGTLRSLGHYLPRPMFVPPGLLITQRVYLSANVTVAATVNFSLLVQPIEL